MTKLFFAVSGLFFLSISCFAQKNSYQQSVVGFYNLENFYDTTDNPAVKDDDFTPNGEKNYSGEIYLNKVGHLATVLSQIGTDINPDGLAFFGVAEVENDTVLTELINHPLLKKRNLKFVHYDSPDIRGVDVGLIYNPKYLTILSSAPLFVKLPGGSKDSYFTRDVLYVKAIYDHDTVHIFVNHWPSRLGGEERSAPARAAAAMVSKIRVDSLMALNLQTKIIIMGDLNDDPTSPSLTKVLKTKGNRDKVKPGDLYNPWVELFNKGIGTLGYNDAWTIFDQIIISSGWLNKDQAGWFYRRQYIFNKEYMVENMGRFKGYPMRTWDGNIYRGGYSDHFPTYIELLKKVQ